MLEALRKRRREIENEWEDSDNGWMAASCSFDAGVKMGLEHAAKICEEREIYWSKRAKGVMQNRVRDLEAGVCSREIRKAAKELEKK